MNTKFAKVAASLAGIAFLAGVASFSSDLSTDNKSVIKVAQANEAAQDYPKDKKKRKGEASK